MIGATERFIGLRLWRAWALTATILLVTALDLVFSDEHVLLSFVWVPVVLSVAFTGPRVTLMLSLLATAVILLVGGMSGHYASSSYWIRLAAMAMVAVLAVYLSHVVSDRQRRLDQLSNTDALTGLSNRRHLIDRLSVQLRLRRRETSVAVLFIDLDRLKAINGEHGHAGGDAVLRDVANRFSQCIRTEDTLSRFGGDEFVVACPSIANRDEVEALCRRLIGSLTEPFFLNGTAEHVGATVGAIIVPPSKHAQADGIIQEADTTLMRLKQEERGCFAVTDYRDAEVIA